MAKQLPVHLRRKAEGLLRSYGGVEGFSKNPPWVIAIVLKTWFDETERKLLADFLFQGVERRAKLLLMKEIVAG